MIDQSQRSLKFIRDDNGCMNFLANGKISPYPKISITQEGIKYVISISRFLWIAKYGLIPDGLEVLHNCDNRSCINVDHFFLGTQTDNMKDRQEKGRQPKGERIGSSKLTEEQVNVIRTAYTTGEYNQPQLAKIFGVKQQVISDVILRKTWKHI